MKESQQVTYEAPHNDMGAVAQNIGQRAVESADSVFIEETGPQGTFEVVGLEGVAEPVGFGD